MVTWYKVKWIDPLFLAFNLAFPLRLKASDGTIGDLEHMQGVSGHNPDDTSGVTAERTDADTKPEVRAADVASTLNSPHGVTMQMVINSILATPADLVRLIYIIYNHKIWRKSNGWREESYSGSDPHTGHAHFSGDPAYDEDGSPWQSILKFQEADMLTPEEYAEIVQGSLTDDNVMHYRLRGLSDGDDPSLQPYYNKGWTKIVGNKQLAAGQVKLADGLAAVSQKVDQIAAGGVTHEALVAALLDPAVLAAIRQAAFEGAQRAEDE